MGIPLIHSGNFVTLHLSGSPYTLEAGTPVYNQAMEAIKAHKNEKEVLDIVLKRTDISMAVASATKGKAKYINGDIYFNGQVLHSNLAKRIVRLAQEGLPIESFLLFLENLEENPSYNSRNQLYDFLEHENLVITDDGHFLAYKTVLSNYMDKHTGKTHDNHPGNLIKMDRKLIDDNPNSHCSRGLHVGAIGYVKGYFHSNGDKIVICKINPRDVVSVPHDHNAQKCRVCEYLVLSDMQAEMTGALYTGDGKPYDIKSNFDPSVWDTLDNDFLEDDYEDDDIIDNEYTDLSEEEFVLPEAL